MRAGLDSLNQRNRNDQPFTVADVEPYVQFFDDYGTPNDRMLAHYLMGRAYHDHGEAPMALQCYQDAIDCADTTDTDSYALLGRVYAQMAEVFYRQGLYRQQLSHEKSSVKYECLGRDTLAALMSYEQQSFAYNNLGMPDSAIRVIEDVASKYEQYGYDAHAATALGSIVKTLLERGEYQKAKHYMDIYERASGNFTPSGDIEHGREIYYKVKGLYYLYLNRMDSAEYFFRKELCDGPDFNNQNAAAMGLALLYQKLHRTDSSAKYAIYAYAMNDSLYLQKTTQTVQRMQALHDYTRNQELAKKKSEEARQNKEKLHFTITLLIGLVLAVAVMAYKIVRKRRESLALYVQSLKELKQLREEKESLSLHQEEYSMMILEKDKKIDYLEQRVKKYGKQAYFSTANAERCLRESPIYKDFEKKAIHGQYLVEEDWKKINILISEYLPSFEDFLSTNRHQLKGYERQIMILLRLHFKAVDIAGMIGLSKSQISQNCTEIMKKIFNNKGSSKELSSKLSKIF